MILASLPTLWTKPKTILGTRLLAALGLLAAVWPVSAQPPTPPASQPTSRPVEVYTAWPFDAKEAVKRQDETAKAMGLPKEMTLDLGGKVTMKFIVIPAGKYRMGSPGAQHEVTVGTPYYMGVYKVTQAQYEQVMGKNPSADKGHDFPVSQVTWMDAEDFCVALSKKTGKTVRLPTAMQWEYTCRAGADSKFFWGDYESKLGEYVWYRENNGGKMHAVGQKKPNAWGLYDSNGLMWEYCGPVRYDPDKKSTAGSEHSCRGATWGSRPPMFVMGVSMAAPSDPKAQGLDRFGMRVIMEAE
jgi:formylglycine-generating enzyme required for sulfatase activity